MIRSLMTLVFRYSNVPLIIDGTGPVILGTSIILFGSCSNPLGKITISTCVYGKNLLGFSQNIIAATFLIILLSFGPVYKSILSRISSNVNWRNSLTSLLSTFFRCSNTSNGEISSIVISGLPLSSKGVRLAISRSSSRTSPLAIIELLPERIYHCVLGLFLLTTLSLTSYGRLTPAGTQITKIFRSSISSTEVRGI